MLRKFLPPGRGRRTGVIAALVAMPAIAVGFVFWRAAHARDEAAVEVAAQSKIGFRVLAVDRAASSAVEAIAAAPGFRDVAFFQNNIVVSASAGLFVYDRNGTLIRSYRAGMELPAGELGAMSEGRLAGASACEVFIATREAGLLAFDGERFRQILPDEPGSRNITAVLALDSGRLLIGTERGGLLEFDGERLSTFQAKLKNSHITALAGTEGDVWIGTLAGGLFHYRGGELEDLHTELPDPQVLSLALADRSCYAGTPLGVVEFRDGRRVRTLADGFFARSLAVSQSTLHVGTEDEGILDLALQARAVAPVPTDAAPSGPILGLTHLETEVYATAEKAIYRYSSGSKRWEAVLTSQNSVMADRNVSALALSEGRLWIGYFDRGLDVVEADLGHATHREDDTIFCVNRIAGDAAHNRTAVATSNGLVLFDALGQPRQILGRKDGLLSDHINDVAFRDGGMVVATPAGLSFVDRARVRSLYVFHGLVNNHVYSVATDGARTVAGTLGGLSLLDEDRVRANFTTGNSHLRHNWITAVVRVGEEWFAGTYGAGVLMLDSAGEWHAFADLNERLVVNPNAMAASAQAVYAGSLDRGLFVYDRASGRWTNKTEGLPSKNVTALAAGGGYLYIGTDNGLVRMREERLR